MKNIFPSHSLAGIFAVSVSVMVLCSYAAPNPVQSERPPETLINKGAGRGDLLLVTLRLESGKELLFTVDTGASATMLDSSLEPELGKRLGTKTFRWIGGRKQKAGSYKAPKLYLGDAQLLTGDSILTADLSGQDRRIKGILGIDCLRHYCIQLDFEAGKMRFLDPDGLRNDALGKAFPISFNSFTGHAIVHENLMNAKDVNSTIDTGCNLDGVLTTRLFQQWTNGWRNAATMSAGEAHFPNGMFGGQSYTNLYLAGGGGYNLIGLSFLARNLVTLNFPKRTMYVRRTSVGPLPNRGFFDDFYPKQLRP